MKGEATGRAGKGTVLGGRLNQRSWETLVEIATNLSNLNFKSLAVVLAVRPTRSTLYRALNLMRI